ncbi:MAG: flavohemoglobin expression-modulating QEGLA motif protein [Saprospiraceae bacterium]|nr:flavohemoglobin expression-modulating QEGLA motif protein [Saprospiraceae bacterium]
MQHLEIKEIIKLIKSGKTFEAISTDGSLKIKITRYLPYCCTAIHDGSNLRTSLSEKIALDNFSRWHEEDPFTGDFIASMPITLIANDSRFEYDLNRNPDDCIYEEAWGKKVWKRSLTPKEIQISKQKHANYYKVTHALIEKLEELFDACVVYDFHSYNYKRWDRKVPLFNIGTEKLDINKYNSILKNWTDELSAISLPDIENVTNTNDVFFGRGYNLQYITDNFKNTLVLATEVKKVYCDELTGDVYPKIVKLLQQKLKKAILNNANFFSHKMTNWKFEKAAKLLDNNIDNTIFKVDKGLYNLLKNFELLVYVNPNNTKTEKNRFFKSKFTEPPRFKYRPIPIEFYSLKQELSNLKVQDISDITIRNLYESVINSYFDKIDLLSTLNTPKFLYNSLRYYGRPTKKDIQNAQYLLYVPPIAGEPTRSPSLGTDQAIQSFKESLESYGFDAKIELSNKVISQVMVLNSKKTILFKPDAKFTRTEISAMVAHEIGVHMLTTINSNLQKLKIFNLGLPVNTMTQEGLAILSEYLSGNITIKRLKKIAYRVIITDMMCSGANFMECFKFLIDNHMEDPNDAFSLVTRIFRGGGFTKDYLYLNGFVKTLRFWESNHNLEPLLVGKTSLEFYNTIVEMIERDMIQKPKYITQSFIKPKIENNNEIYEYIFSGLK